jgi:hypothetical protein
MRRSMGDRHVRELALKANVNSAERDRPKFEALANDLKRVGVISEAERKQLTAWYNLRSNAAHGQPIVDSHVGPMIVGVRDFLVRHPA